MYKSKTNGRINLKSRGLTSAFSLLHKSKVKNLCNFIKIIYEKILTYDSICDIIKSWKGGKDNG